MDVPYHEAAIEKTCLEAADRIESDKATIERLERIVDAATSGSPKALEAALAAKEDTT